MDESLKQASVEAHHLSAVSRWKHGLAHRSWWETIVAWCSGSECGKKAWGPDVAVTTGTTARGDVAWGTDGGCDKPRKKSKVLGVCPAIPDSSLSDILCLPSNNDTSIRFQSQFRHARTFFFIIIWRLQKIWEEHSFSYFLHNYAKAQLVWCAPSQLLKGVMSCLTYISVFGLYWV